MIWKENSGKWSRHKGNESLRLSVYFGGLHFVWWKLVGFVQSCFLRQCPCCIRKSGRSLDVAKSEEARAKDGKNPNITWLCHFTKHKDFCAVWNAHGPKPFYSMFSLQQLKHSAQWLCLHFWEQYSRKWEAKRKTHLLYWWVRIKSEKCVLCLNMSK